jgi:hypothetical protein
MIIFLVSKRDFFLEGRKQKEKKKKLITNKYINKKELFKIFFYLFIVVISL